MIIDSHTHLGRNNHINASVDELLQSMDRAGIDKSLVFAGDMNDAPNKWVLEQVKPHRDRLMMVAAAQPHKFQSMSEIGDDAWRLADMYQAADIVAVKFYTGYDHYYPSDDVAREYLMELEDVECPVIFHMGDCLSSIKHAKIKYAQPIHVDEVAVDYSDTNFVIAHMGYPWVRDAGEVCYKNANVYTDVSGFVYGEFSPVDQEKFLHNILSFLDISGTDKLLFGSDWPISDQKSYVDTLTNNITAQLNGFTPQVMTQNTIRAFKLKERT